MDPTRCRSCLAEAHCSLGNIAWHEWDWATALSEFRTAIDLKPDYATARQWYAETLASVGRLEEAKAEIERALQADPTSLIINTSAGSIHLMARDYDGALERCEKTLDMDPAFGAARGVIIWTYISKGMYAEASAEQDKVPGPPDTNTLGTRGVIAAATGRRTEALRLLRELEEASRREYLPPTTPAAVWTALGDKDRAFPLLQRACSEHDSGLIDIKVAPWFDTLRSDPRFKQLLNCTHLD
jgi:tetratricopeptide (TPR) repeat protein